MEIGAMLDELREKALKDRNIWQELMDTRKAEQPLAAFCAKCRELGYQIYEMDLITAGEEFYATMRRSTNGGGENSPKLAGEDDFYEVFFASLEEHTKHLIPAHIPTSHSTLEPVMMELTPINRMDRQVSSLMD